jgi:hypothetical protein
MKDKELSLCACSSKNRVLALTVTPKDLPSALAVTSILSYWSLAVLTSLVFV